MKLVHTCLSTDHEHNPTGLEVPPLKFVANVVLPQWEDDAFGYMKIETTRKSKKS